MAERFTLETGRWYACEFIGDFFDQAFGPDRCSYSPIKILGLRPLGTGQREYVLEFYHANYPEGVQGKEYRLRTIERGGRFLLAKSLDHDPPRFLQVYDITAAWIEAHFPGKHPPREGLQAWMGRNA
jgi:hypothetical protein